MSSFTAIPAPNVLIVGLSWMILIVLLLLLSFPETHGVSVSSFAVVPVLHLLIDWFWLSFPIYLSIIILLCLGALLSIG